MKILQKNKAKLIVLSMLVVFTFFRCQRDDVTVDKEKAEKQEHTGTNPNQVSLDFFKSITKIDNVDAFAKKGLSHLNSPNTQNRNSDDPYSFSEFYINTDYVMQCVLNNEGDLAFSFKIYLLEDNPANGEHYNLVIKQDENNEWESSIFLLVESNDQNSENFFSTIDEVYYTNELPNNVQGRSGFTMQCEERFSYHCTNTGRCFSEGICDNCPECVTRTVVCEMVYVEGPEAPNDNSLVDPSFNFNPGGGSSGSSNADAVRDMCISDISEALDLSPEETECLESSSMSDACGLSNDIDAFLDSNLIEMGSDGQFTVYGNSLEDIEFAKLAVEAICNGGEVDYEEQIIYSLQNPCQNAIVRAAQETDSSIAQDIQAAFGVDSQNDGPLYNLMIGQDGDLGVRAVTSSLPGCYVGQCTFSMTFGSLYLSQATDLSIAATTIHESVHALLSYRFHTGELEVQGAANPNIAELVIAYTFVQASNDPANDGTNDTLNDLQHQYMVGLINDMGDALYAWAIATNTNDGNSSYNPMDFTVFDSDSTDNMDGLKEYCRNMFWTPTLRETTNFANLPFNYRQLVEAIDQAEATGQTTPYNDLNNTWYDIQPNGNQAPSGEPCNY